MKLRIVFLGTPDFAVESLRRIHEAGYDIAAVVTMPDKPAGRGHKMYQSPVKEYAVAHGLTLLQPVKLKDPEFVDKLRSLDANLFVVIAFRMLPEIVWSMPELGTFNLHASLLPRYRGAAPINRAVMNGDTTTGVTTFFLKHEIDTGDIIDQRSIEIGEDENVGSVHDRLMMLGADLTLDTLARIEAGNLVATPQEALSGEREATPAPKIFKEDCLIDWAKTAREIHNHVRGLSPYPGAWSVLSVDGVAQGDLKIFSTRRTDTVSEAAPGTIVATDKAVYVTTGDHLLIEIGEVQLQGKRRMSACDLLRGMHLASDAALTLA